MSQTIRKQARFGDESKNSDRNPSLRDGGPYHERRLRMNVTKIIDLNAKGRSAGRALAIVVTVISLTLVACQDATGPTAPPPPTEPQVVFDPRPSPIEPPDRPRCRWPTFSGDESVKLSPSPSSCE